VTAHPAVTADIAMSVAMSVVAVVLVLVGNWGWRNAVRLVPQGISTEDRARQERVLRRGAVACYAAAALLVFAAIGSLL
jgi:hypothetical protein